MTPYLTSAFQGMGSSAATSFGNAGGTGLGNALFGGIAARRQWKYQQKQMKLQQQYALEQMAKSAEYQLVHDKEMFDYENAYNDPSKVFERYLKAGVTPAAVLGSSGVGVSIILTIRKTCSKSFINQILFLNRIRQIHKEVIFNIRKERRIHRFKIHK